jgi:hypothetical protein
MPQQKLKCDYMKDSFCKELKRVFDKFPKYNMKAVTGEKWEPNIHRLQESL